MTHWRFSGEAISELFGSISLTASVCLLLPQLFKNYNSKRADALSLLFLVVWLLGDIASLIGAVITHLAPSATVLAGYLCFSDSCLILQCIYYNSFYKREDGACDVGAEAELNDGNSEQQPFLPAANHVSYARNDSNQSSKPVDDIHPMERRRTAWHINVIFIGAVYATGTVLWIFGSRTSLWDAFTVLEDGHDGTGKNLIGVLLGYFSALCYLCAPMPQIVKNYQNQSCDGLAPLFFLLSMTGNFAYGISVLAYSQDRDYLLNGIPWLLGSLGALVEDVIIFAQFLWLG